MAEVAAPNPALGTGERRGLRLRGVVPLQGAVAGLAFGRLSL